MGIASDNKNGQTTQRNRISGCYRLIKRGFDILFAISALLLLLFPMLLIALLIRIFDGKPVLYRQTRLGRKGRHITILKFRSMCLNADSMINDLPSDLLAQYRQEFKIDRDPRVTRIGSFLRRTSLDELPQLWNILRGDLSLVGPRPILPDEISFYNEADRPLFLSATPGLTGYWQACAGPEDTYTSGKRQQMELHYAANTTFLFDLRIFFQTFMTVIRKIWKQ